MINQIGDIFKCNHCEQIADQAVEAQCCGTLFCQQCYDYVNKSKKRCKKCQIIGFQSRPCLFARSHIGKLDARCKYECGISITFQEKKDHESACPLKIIECKKCNQKLKTNLLFEHMSNKHKKDLYILMVSYHLQEEQPPTHQVKVKREKLDSRIFTYSKINSNENQANLGSTGKYYCGRRTLIGKCGCCDGRCGPTNGENCDACMQLDCIRFNLPQGSLVNTRGIICSIGNTGVFSCGKKLKNGYCHENNPCSDCNKVTNSVKKLGRYKQLIQ